jgi:CheY-like chemotaxis protein
VTNNDNIVERLARRAGVSDVISKPIKAQRVLQVLMKYLNPLKTNP